MENIVKKWLKIDTSIQRAVISIIKKKLPRETYVFIKYYITIKIQRKRIFHFIVLFNYSKFFVDDIHLFILFILKYYCNIKFYHWGNQRVHIVENFISEGKFKES